jgi:3-dehydroquinate dehydratase-2
MASFLVLHGPNLNLLGSREPDLYGSTTLEEINARLSGIAGEAGHRLESFQSNAEHELLEKVQSARGRGVDMILINPAAFTHTSVALRDALLAAELPFIEIHLSNIHAREASDRALGVITGFGAIGYELALRAGLHHLTRKNR